MLPKEKKKNSTLLPPKKKKYKMTSPLEIHAHGEIFKSPGNWTIEKYSKDSRGEDNENGRPSFV